MSLPDLTQFDSEYATAAPPENTNEEPPDGKYEARVAKVEIKESKTSGKPYLKWQLVIDNGPHTGRYLFRNNQMSSAENLAWLKKDLGTCGLKLEKLSDLPNRLNDLLDKRVKVTKKSRGENYNVYLDKLLATSAPVIDSGPAKDVPF